MRAVGIMCLAMATSGTAGAQTAAHVARVLFLPAGSRTSVVLELTGAPGTVTSRRISGDLLEVDAAAVAIDRARAFTAPAGTDLVSNVIVDEGPGTGSTLRARLTLRDGASAEVRVAGTRLYVDVAASEAPGATAQRVRTVPRPVSVRSDSERSKADVPKAPQATQAVQADADLRGAIARFGEMLPFVVSTADAPTADVMSALTASLSTLRQEVAGVHASAAMQPVQGLLTAAIAAATTAIDPAYAGDRVGQARQAAMLFQQAKGAI